MPRLAFAAALIRHLLRGALFRLRVASYHCLMHSRRAAVLVLGVACIVALSAAASGPSKAAPPSGGTLRIVLAGEIPTLDPAITPLGWGPIWYGACATLMAFRDAAAPEGLTVRPEAAVAAPMVSDGGRTYVFTVRKGLRFSDGSPLTAANFVHALKRVLNPIMRSEGASVFSDVRRMTATGRRLRIELRKPRGDLALRLALPWSCPVPLGFPTDPAGVPLMVGTGPYYVTRNEGNLVVVERNRYYRGSRPRRIDRLVLTISAGIASNISAVAEGRADFLGNDVGDEFRVQLAQRYGVNKSQFFVTRGTFTHHIYFNMSRRLFRNNVALRKAVNLALNRAAIARARGGAPAWRPPTDQILTHWMPEWVDHRLYPLTRPNLRRARTLAAGNLRGGKAVMWVSPFRPNLDEAEVVVRNLREIGLEVEVKPVASAVVNSTASKPGAPYDMGMGSFPLDYPDPANVIIRLLAGENARKPTGNSNYAYFDVPAYNRRMAAADRLSGSARARAFSKLEADMMRNAAPWAPVYEVSSTVFVSKRVGCVKTHPVFRLDYAAVCLA